MTHPPVVRIAELGTGLTEVGRARRALARTLDGWGVVGDCADVAILLADELVTNAIRHGAGPVLLCAVLQPGTRSLLVEVHDSSPVEVAPRCADVDDVDGRGLLLVDELADVWGCRLGDPGKKVWFRLDDFATAC